MGWGADDRLQDSGSLPDDRGLVVLFAVPYLKTSVHVKKALHGPLAPGVVARRMTRHLVRQPFQGQGHAPYADSVRDRGVDIVLDVFHAQGMDTEPRDPGQGEDGPAARGHLASWEWERHLLPHLGRDDTADLPAGSREEKAPWVCVCLALFLGRPLPAVAFPLCRGELEV